MSSFDVRDEENEEVTSIVFAEEEDEDGDCQACIIVKAYSLGYVCIYDTLDCSEESVSISSKEHAHNLIKALNKAIELGWLE